MAGDLFRIAQEAVVNAGRHADADAVSLSLRASGRRSSCGSPTTAAASATSIRSEPSEPGHLGPRDDARARRDLGGTLEIETSERGTRVLVRAPLPPRGA